MKLKPYSKEIEQQMRNFYKSLTEKDKRRYAGIEATKLGYGGVSYICRVLNCDNHTVTRGQEELKSESLDKEERIRKSGGGRKSILATVEGINEAFLEVIESSTAGSPMDENIKWTNFSREKLSLKLKEKGFSVSVTVIDQLLKKNNFRPRKAFKNEAGKINIPDRDEQFKNIERLKEEYHKNEDPVMSMDVKKKELIGNLFRDGMLYTQEVITVKDHDFLSYAEGKIVPHGLYDVYKNKGYMTLGVSGDTSEFSCEAIRQWWLDYGKIEYPNSTKLLLLCDGGGSNSSRHYLFKEDLQKLSNELNIEIRIAHYPPYTSKYNPIEHRLFPHITRNCQGIIFKTIDLVNNLMEQTTTSKGLNVVSRILDKTFETGRKVAKGFKENMKIKFDDFLPKWNYVAVPISG